MVQQLCEEGDEQSLGVSVEDIPFDIPDSWQWTTLGECVQFNPKFTREDEINVSFVPMADVDAGFVNSFKLKEEKIWKKAKSGYSKFEDGDVLLAKITPCFENRKSCIISELKNGAGAGSTEFHVLRCGEKLNPSFLLWFLKTRYLINYGVLNFKGTAGQQRIGTQDLKKCLIPLPPLEEQKRIVAKIEELLPLVEEYGKSYDHLQKINAELPEKLRASILQEAIQGKLVPQLDSEGIVEQVGDVPEEVPFEIPENWRWCTLKVLVTPTKQKVPDINFSYIDVAAIEKFKIVKTKALSPNEAPSRARKIVKEGMILYSTVRPYLKNVCIASDVKSETIASTAFATFECSNIVFNKYLFYVLLSEYFCSYVRNVQKGVAYPAINDKDFYSSLIPLPPFSEQKRIVAKIEELLKQVDALKV